MSIADRYFAVLHDAPHRRVPGPTLDPWAVPVLAVGLLVALFAAVPLVHLASGVPLLALVGVTIIGYVVAIVAIDRPVAGVIAALFTLATTSASLPLVYADSSRANLEIFIADPFLGAVLALVAWWVYIGALERPRGLIVVGLALAWVGWAALAAVFGAGPSSTTAFFFAIDQARFAGYLLAGVCLAVVLPLRPAVVTVAIAGVAHAPVAIAQSLVVGPIGLSPIGSASREVPITTTILGRTVETGYPVGGFAGNATALATITLLSAVVAIYYLVRGSRVQRRLAAAALPIVVISTFLSGSDTAIGSLVLVSGATSAVLFRDRIPRPVREGIDRYRRETALAAGGCVGASLLVIWAIGTETVFRYVPIADGDGLGPRIQHYQAALEIGREYPLFGLGGANFELVAHAYGMERANAIHSTPAEVLSGTGVVGLALYLSLLGAVAYYGVRIVGRGRVVDRQTALLLGLWGGGFALLSLFNLIWPAQSSNSVFWLLAGLIVGTGQSGYPRGRPGLLLDVRHRVRGWVTRVSEACNSPIRGV